MEEEKKKVKFTDLFKYLKYTYKYAKDGKFLLIGVLIVNIFLTTISVVVPILNAKEIVNLTDGNWKKLLIIVLSVFGLEISRNIFRYIYSYFWNQYFYKVRKNIQLALTEETLKISTNDLNNTSSGVFIERICTDTEKITDVFVELLDFASNIIANIGIFVSVLFINVPIFFIYLIYNVSLFFIQKRNADIVQEKRRIHVKNREKINGFSSEIVRGAKDIKILNAEKSFLNHSSDILEDLKKSGLEMHLTRAKYRLINGNLVDGLDLIISLVGMYFIMHDMMNVAALLIIYNYSHRIRNISNDLENLIEYVNMYNLAANRIFGILIEGEFTKEKFGKKHVKKLNGNIKFNNVTFRYDDNPEVLKNMTFEVEENKTVAFVGKSGAGKSTIFNLISKLYEVSDGNIYLDDIDINELDRESIRGNLSIISQNPYIYNMSIRENLQIIKKDATEDDIINACKMACLHDFIISLKDGYDTLVGEGGVTLSGGQKQRLAIARAFLLGTKIILFDEATSALDNETQKQITKAIENMKGEYTVLIIAHRLSTVSNADKIFVVDNGRIVDEGNKSYLLKNSRTFKKLYETELEDIN